VRRAYIGVAGGTRPLPPRARRELGQSTCVEIVEVAPGSPAEQAGLRAEDLVVDVAGEQVATVTDLQRLMAAELIGSTVAVSVIRQGRRRGIDVVPVELP
jgi:serine protease Do